MTKLVNQYSNGGDDLADETADERCAAARAHFDWDSLGRSLFNEVRPI